MEVVYGHKCFYELGFGNAKRLSISRRSGRAFMSSALNSSALPNNPFKSHTLTVEESITKHDVIHYLASGCKPKDQWRIGTEHEKFGFELGNLHPLKYEQLSKLLNVMADKFDWERVIEGHLVIGLKKGKQSISLEGGGQLELSGAPVETLHHASAEIESHLYQVKAVAESMGIGFLGIGFHPKCKNEDICMIPKQRFEIHKNYFPKVGSHGFDIMFRSSTVQVNLDFSSELDMIKKFRASLALQPIAIALYANSPFTEGKPNGHLSFRSYAWTDFDKSRTGMLPIVFNDSFGFEQYVDYALDVPMICIHRKNKYIDCTRSTFREFMAGKLEAIPGELPNINDWESHLGSLYPEVRLKKYLEMRGADAGPLNMLYALPAFWVGLLYDEISLQNVLNLIADWTEDERQMLRNEVPRTGLNTPFRDGLLRHVAQDVVKWARDGLERRNFGESSYLDAVLDVARTGVTQAEKLLDMYYGKWEQRIEPVFEDLLY